MSIKIVHTVCFSPFTTMFMIVFDGLLPTLIMAYLLSHESPRVGFLMLLRLAIAAIVTTVFHDYHHPVSSIAYLRGLTPKAQYLHLAVKHDYTPLDLNSLFLDHGVW